ncbi:MAG: indole-3-glycerol phosphate synthase TrpC [Actinomycetes bacterium]
MTTVLDSIVDGVRLDLHLRKSNVSLAELQERVSSVSDALPVADILAARDFSVIAEVKRSSPSKGHLAEITEPSVLAQSYESGGAAVISVLTEQRRFGGSLADLDAIRAAVKIPILRKDFIVEEYQVWETRAHGADLVLLIVASLDDAQLRDLHALSVELGMSVLVEVHDSHELERAMRISPRIVGVNARNLKTLEVDLAVCHSLIPTIPPQVVTVAESGISQVAQVSQLAATGACAVLVGEALVTSGSPEQTVREWTNAGRAARNGEL